MRDEAETEKRIRGISKESKERAAGPSGEQV